MTPGSRLARLAARAGLSEGQAYTVAILAVVAALLMSSLTGLTGRIADVAAAPLTPGDEPEVAAPAPAPPEESELPAGEVPPPFAPPDPPPLLDASPPTTDGPAAPIDPEDPPPPAPCGADPLIAVVRELVATLDPLTGGALPDGTVVSALAVATGCSRTDPAILLLAGLIEIGQGLPDLGLGFLELPVLPFLAIPEPVIELVQPLREVLDPLCNTIATVTVITSQVGPSYPYPIDAVFSVSLFYALATCGQLQDTTF